MSNSSTRRRAAMALVFASLTAAAALFGAGPASAAINDPASGADVVSGQDVDVDFTVPSTASINAASIAVCATSGPGTNCDGQAGHFTAFLPVAPGTNYLETITVDDFFPGFDFTTNSATGSNVSCDGTGAGSADVPCSLSVSYYTTGAGAPVYRGADTIAIDFVS